ncbi:signal transducer and activator of transcription 1-alpha/beta isoform X2 [Patella vulgata]|uniref:signal transducer and activator of transcription 1-alpha/beta isoform X2 n=1 Tax=Patella vulgata TaxID=6465 RepID=UPI00217FAE8B|nr:signal transducer and activator of transcription 1-alpha/beta isoform X2 [Patella vulgata]
MERSMLSECLVYPPHICEIFLAKETDLRQKLLDYDQKDKSLRHQVAQNIFQFLEQQYGILETSNLKSLLLNFYWSKTKEEINDKKLGNIYLIQCFQQLSSKWGKMSQSVSPILSTSPVTDCDERVQNMLETESKDMKSVSMKLQKLTTDIKDLKDVLGTVSANYQRGVEMVNVYKNPDDRIMNVNLSDFESYLKKMNTDYNNERKRFLEKCTEVCKDVEHIAESVIKCIEQWIHSQKLFYVKAGANQSLDEVEYFCHSLFREIMNMIHMIGSDGFNYVEVCQSIFQDQGNLSPDNVKFNKKVCYNKLKECLQDLLQKSFVVIEQPVDVQKVTGPGGADKTPTSKDKVKDKKSAGSKAEDDKSGSGKKKVGPEFNTKVQILCGKGLECIKTVTKPVTAKFFYEGNLKTDKDPVVSAQLNIPQATVNDQGIADFSKQKIKQFERPSKTNKTEQVTSERYRIVFETEITLRNPDINLDLKTMSLPMAVITGSNQANSSHGSLLWYCYNNDPYDLTVSPNTVVSKQTVINMIQACFSYLNGRALRPDEIEFLLEKMLKDRDNENISFEDFIGKSSPNSNEPTFWKWLQSILNLIEHYLKLPWLNGIIHGFVSKERCKSLLCTESPGTFLLRFSETVVEGDGQNKNLTGALVVAITLVKAVDSKHLVTFTRPLTVVNYFSKYSFKDILSGITGENTKKRETLLKKVYEKNVTMPEIKKTYTSNTSKQQEQDQNYPDWIQQTIQTLRNVSIGDDGDDSSDEEVRKRKVPRRISDMTDSSIDVDMQSDASQSSVTLCNVYSTENIPAFQTPVPFDRNAANNLIKKKFGSWPDSTNIPSTVEDFVSGGDDGDGHYNSPTTISQTFFGLSTDSSNLSSADLTYEDLSVLSHSYNLHDPTSPQDYPVSTPIMTTIQNSNSSTVMSPGQIYNSPATMVHGQKYNSPATMSPSQNYNSPTSQNYNSGIVMSPGQNYNSPTMSPTENYNSPTVMSQDQTYNPPTVTSPTQNYNPPTVMSPPQNFNVSTASQNYNFSISTAVSPSQNFDPVMDPNYNFTDSLADDAQLLPPF